MDDKNHHNDQPISQPAEDRFGVDPFAKALASSIRKLASPEGAVIALNGPWGLAFEQCGSTGLDATGSERCSSSIGQRSEGVAAFRQFRVLLVIRSNLRRRDEFGLVSQGGQGGYGGS